MFESREVEDVLGLVAYGHSYVEGAAASRACRRFVDIVSGRLGGTLRNNGVGGSLSTDTAALVTTEPPPPAKYYLVMTGLNDARLHGEDPRGRAGYAAALAAIFGALTEAYSSCRIIAVEQPYLRDYSQHSPYDKGSDALVVAYNETLREVAARFPSVLLCPVEFWSGQTMIAADTVHPNDIGHREIACAVYDAVVKSRP